MDPQKLGEPSCSKASTGAIKKRPRTVTPKDGSKLARGKDLLAVQDSPKKKRTKTLSPTYRSNVEKAKPSWRSKEKSKSPVPTPSPRKVLPLNTKHSIIQSKGPAIGDNNLMIRSIHENCRVPICGTSCLVNAVTNGPVETEELLKQKFPWFFGPSDLTPESVVIYAYGPSGAGKSTLLLGSKSDTITYDGLVNKVFPGQKVKLSILEVRPLILFDMINDDSVQSCSTLGQCSREDRKRYLVKRPVGITDYNSESSRTGVAIIMACEGLDYTMTIIDMPGQEPFGTSVTITSGNIAVVPTDSQHKLYLYYFEAIFLEDRALNGPWKTLSEMLERKNPHRVLVTTLNPPFNVQNSLPVSPLLSQIRLDGHFPDVEELIALQHHDQIPDPPQPIQVPDIQTPAAVEIARLLKLVEQQAQENAELEKQLAAKDKKIARLQKALTNKAHSNPKPTPDFSLDHSWLFPPDDDPDFANVDRENPEDVTLLPSEDEEENEKDMTLADISLPQHQFSPVSDEKVPETTSSGRWQRIDNDSDSGSISGRSDSHCSTVTNLSSDSSGVRRSERVARRECSSRDSSSAESSSSTSRKKMCNLDAPEEASRRRGRSASPCLVDPDDDTFGLLPMINNKQQRQAREAAIMQFLPKNGLTIIQPGLRLEGYQVPYILEFVTTIQDLELRVPWDKAVKLLERRQYKCLLCSAAKPKPDSGMKEHLLGHYGARLGCPISDCDYTIGTVATIVYHLAQKHSIHKI